MNYDVGERVMLRCFGGQTVHAYVVRRRLFVRLVSWGVNESWDEYSPVTNYVKTKWRPVWRLHRDKATA